MVTANVVTVAKMCELLQAGPGEIKAAAESAGVRPALVINGRAHYAESDLPRIREKLSERRKEPA